MRRNPLTPLIIVVVVALGALAATMVSGNEPELGLDLQGGASVVLQPPEDVAGDDVLDQSIEIIRNRIDALGVAEPDITRQGDAIIVELPGVRDQQQALDVVGQTAELRFRPVLASLPPEGEAPPEESTTTTTAPSTTTTTAPGETTTTTAPTTSTTVAPTDATTPRDENTADATVILPLREDEDEPGAAAARYQLGPAGALGNAVSGADATLQPNGSWGVDLEFTNEGIDAFNALASQCYGRGTTCPSGQLGIELDGVVQSAPVVQQPSFTRDQVVISGDFSEGDAKQLALVLRFGALPVQLEPQNVQTVSASLGEESLKAGLIAGAIGTALVLLYMLLYYRALGLVVVLGLAVWTALQWSIISYLGATRGLALSLAGVTGLIVSIGVTVDSYVVYFERFRDEVRAGRSVRASVDRSFKRAFRTILAADVAAFIGAFLLYVLTVGPVRGFAFFLGLSTLLDLVVAYFFTRPLVAVLARRRVFTGSGFLGLGTSVRREPEPAVVTT